jgi:hypothetical protein
MISRPAPRPASARQLFLALAALAVLMKVLVPPGFMAAPRANDLPFALTLCTSQGPLIVEPGGRLPGSPQDHAPGGKAAHDSPCAFAGHGAAGPAPEGLVAPAADVVAYAAAATPARRFDLAPGRGLAAPPLPARGPPVRTI